MERSFCTKCGQPNIATSSLCAGCGAVLAQQVAFLRAPEENSPLVCPQCKTLNPPGATVCNRCNNPLLPPGGNLIGGTESSGRAGGRIKLEPAMFGEAPASPSKAKPVANKAPSRLAQAAAKRDRDKTGEDTTPDWLVALRDGEATAQPTTATPPVEATQAIPPAAVQVEIEPTHQSAPSVLPNQGESASELEYEPIAPATFDPNRPPVPDKRIATSELPDWLTELTPATTNSKAISLPENAQPDADLAVFNPEEMIQAQPVSAPPKPQESNIRQPKVISTEELGSGIPDWLKDLTTTNNKTSQAKPGGTGRIRPAVTDGLKTNEDIPDWLRDVAKGGTEVDSTPFGDSDQEIERTLNFAFNGEAGFAPRLRPTTTAFATSEIAQPAEKPRKGLTNELEQLPDLTGENSETDLVASNPDIQNYAAYAAVDTASTLPTEDDLNEVEPFALPTLDEEDSPSSQVESIQAETVSTADLPLWGAGLAPWLLGLRPPALELEEPAVAVANQEPGLPQAAPHLDVQEVEPNWLAEMATLSQTEEAPRIGEIQEKTETRSFSLREMLHQTEGLGTEQLAQANFATPTEMQAENVATEHIEPLEVELPDWLQNPPQPPVDQLEAELPDWLQNSSPPSADAEQYLAEQQDLAPFSLATASDTASITISKEVEPTAVSAPALAQVATPPEVGAEEAEPPPDWLQDMMAGKPVPPVNTYGSTGRKEFSSYSPMDAGREGTTEDLPEWLRDAAKPAPTFESNASTLEEAATTAANEKLIIDAAELADTNKAANDALLDNLFGKMAAQPETNESAAAQIPDWLHEQPHLTAPVLEVPPDLPEWLRQSDSSAVISEASDTHTEPQSEAAFFEGGLVGSDFLSDSDVPAWLRNAAAEPVAEPKTIAQPAQPAPDSSNPATLPAWLRAVGTQISTAEEAEELDDHESFNIGLPRVEVPPTLAGTAVLTTLLGYAPATGKASVDAARKSRFNVALAVRYLSFLALLGVTLLGLLSPFTTTRLTITPVVQSFYDNVESLSAGQKVLLVYDWEADRSGEMRPMAQAVTAHLLNKRAQLVTFSTNPQGPALSEQVTNELIANPAYNNSQNGLYDYGKGYLNLGFVPGNEAAVRSLFTQLNTLSDYRQGRPASEYPIMNGLESLANFNLVIVLAGDETNVRTWIEQFGITPGSKLLLGVPTAVGPMAQPYAFAPPSADVNLQGQLVRAQGLLVGLNGAAQYQQLLQENKNLPTDTNINLSQRLTAQSLGALLLIVIIVVANIVYFLRKRD